MKVSSFEAIAQVLQAQEVRYLYSDMHPETPVDIFVFEPFDFDNEYDLAFVQFLDERLPIRFISLPTLLHLKQVAGRPQDLADIDQLRLKEGMP